MNRCVLVSGNEVAVGRRQVVRSGRFPRAVSLPVILVALFNAVTLTLIVHSVAERAAEVFSVDTKRTPKHFPNRSFGAHKSRENDAINVKRSPRFRGQPEAIEDSLEEGLVQIRARTKNNSFCKEFYQSLEVLHLTAVGQHSHRIRSPRRPLGPAVCPQCKSNCT